MLKYRELLKKIAIKIDGNEVATGPDLKDLDVEVCGACLIDHLHDLEQHQNTLDSFAITRFVTEDEIPVHAITIVSDTKNMTFLGSPEEVKAILKDGGIDHIVKK